METKFCPKCENELPVAAFNLCRYTKDGSKDGLQYRCRKCEKAYREENRERIQAREHTDWLANRERRLAERRRRRAEAKED